MTVAAPSLPAIFGPIRPRPRWREGRLLLIVAAAIVAGSVSLALTGQVADPGESHGLSLANPVHLLVYLGLLGLCHLTLVLSGRRVDEILLPTAGMLGGISLLLMERLPQDQVVQSVGPWSSGSATSSSPGSCSRSAWPPPWRSPSGATSGCGSTSTRGRPPASALLLATFVFGDDVNGQRLSLTIGPVTGQPAELLKVILVVFLAGYLSENRPLLVEESTRVGPISPAAAAVPRPDGRDVGDRPLRSSFSSATSARRSCSSPCSCPCSTSRRPGRLRRRRASSCSSRART